MGRLFAAALVAGGMLVGSVSTAGAATLSGAELYSYPFATFPTSTVQPTVDGSSIVFDPIDGNFQTLMLVELAPSSNTFSISVNMTMLPRDSGLIPDHDPHLMIGDGTNFFGILPSNDGVIYGADVVSGNRTYLQNLGVSGAVTPGVNNPFTVDLAFTLAATTTSVTATYLGRDGSYSRNIAFDLSGPLYFALIGDNENGEIYQINSLTGPIPPVPIPAALPLLLSALGVFGFFGWRRKRAAA